MENVPKLVETICPRCDGNGFIKIAPVIATVGDGGKEIDCPQCEVEFLHMGKKVTTHSGYVFLPIEDTRKNVEGGRESKIKWSGETLPEVGKE
tara:strand:- start:274 stop:552 length:279 start_codon:yes stop_codon:yes gene_type:complete